MREIKLRDAKATLSAVINHARKGEPSIIIRQGKPEAVLLSFDEWQRLSRLSSFERLLAEAPFKSADLPPRNDSLREAVF